MPLTEGRILQEFYCNDCDGYLHFHIAEGTNKDVVIVCPGPPGEKCGRRHPRRIRNGHVQDNGKGHDDKAEEILITQSAYTKKPITGINKHAREGMTFSELQAQALLDQSKSRHGWFDKVANTVKKGKK